MLIIENKTEFSLPGKSAVALGKFDGIHLGHRKLLDRVLEQKKLGFTTVVFTFDTSAASFFRGEEKALSTREEKRAVFARMGIDVLIEFPLNRETAATEPVDFISRYLARQMQTAYLCAGPDISFGKGGAGDYALLVRCAKDYGYQVELIDKVRVDGKEVSSTRVREAVRAGRMEEVSGLLGAPYSVTGRVVHGRHLGRTLGMPTANLIPAEEKLLPPNGVYYARGCVDGKVYRAISNVGYKPTVSKERILGIETYLYDFDGEIYDSEIQVELLAFRRREQTFDNVEALRRQIAEDVEAGSTWR
ncbi:MAG: riboflavin biosynthesis protein RibF [Lachnospiraceae bacterium]|nr:riboflavin biosynthesis protein RibF [Lachnospiraceae bacterium]